MPSGSPGVSHWLKSWQRPSSLNFSTSGCKPTRPSEYSSFLPVSPELHGAHLDRNRGTLTDCKLSAILLVLPTECSDETTHQLDMLESSFCGFSGEEISLVFKGHNELQMSELSIFIILLSSGTFCAAQSCCKLVCGFLVHLYCHTEESSGAVHLYFHKKEVKFCFRYVLSQTF